MKFNGEIDLIVNAASATRVSPLAPTIKLARGDLVNFPFSFRNLCFRRSRSVKGESRESPYPTVSTSPSL